MIERLIAFALHQRLITLALALLLSVMGVVSFRNLPIEAYPDVGDVRAEVITLWPGHAAEEVERLITIPLENELNGIARVTVIRSDTLFGLSNIRVIFADGTDDYWARQQAQERINQAQLPADAKPGLGPLSSVIGEVYRYTLESKTMSLVELKALQDWVLEREFRQVPGVADVVSWGGGTKQYEIVVDPARLRAYNLTLKQVIDAAANANSNAGGGYIAHGEYRVTVRGLGLLQTTRDIENIVVSAQKGTPVRVRDIGTVVVGTGIRLGVLGRDHEDDLVQGIVLMRKGENPDAVIKGVKAKIAGLQRLLPAGVEMRPYYSRDRLVQTTVHTVLKNLVEGAVLVVVLLTIFLYNLRAAVIVALTIPLSLLFAFIFMDLRGIPAYLLSLGHRLRHHRGRRRHHDREHPAPSRRAQAPGPPRAPRGAARGHRGGAAPDLRRPHHHDRVRPHPHLPAHRGKALPAHGRHHLLRRGGLARAHPHHDPRPRQLFLPAAPLGAGEPDPALAARALPARPALVRAPAPRAPGRHRGPARPRRARLRPAGEGIPARAGRGRSVAAREISHRHLARGRAPLRARDP